MLAAKRSSFEDRLKEAATSWELTLKASRPDDHPELQEALRGLPWKTWDTEVESDATAQIQYGGAPVALVEHVRDVVERIAGVHLPLSKDWSDSDDDIWIHLPSSATVATTEEDAPLDLTAWLAVGVEAEGEVRPFIDVRSDRVRIGPISLRRQQLADNTLVPKPSNFAHYCVDQRTAETLNPRR